MSLRVNQSQNNSLIYIYFRACILTQKTGLSLLN